MQGHRFRRQAGELMTARLPRPDMVSVYDAGDSVITGPRYSVYTPKHGHIAHFFTYAEASEFRKEILTAWIDSFTADLKGSA
jgi:hypothetical protein